MAKIKERWKSGGPEKDCLFDGCGKSPYDCLMCSRYRAEKMKGTGQPISCGVGEENKNLRDLHIHAELESVMALFPNDPPRELADILSAFQGQGGSEAEANYCNEACKALEGETADVYCKTRLVNRFSKLFLEMLHTKEGSEMVKSYMKEAYNAENARALEAFGVKDCDGKEPGHMCDLMRAPEVVAWLYKQTEKKEDVEKLGGSIWSQYVDSKVPTVLQVLYAADQLPKQGPKKEGVGFGQMVKSVVQLEELGRFTRNPGDFGRRCADGGFTTSRDHPDLAECRDLLLFKLASDFVGVVHAARTVGEELHAERARQNWKDIGGKVKNHKQHVNAFTAAGKTAKEKRQLAAEEQAEMAKNQAAADKEREEKEEKRKRDMHSHMEKTIREKLKEKEEKEEKRKRNMHSHMEKTIREKLKASKCLRRLRRLIRAMATRLSRS